MGRNFPSYRSYLRTLIEDIEKVKKLVKNEELVNVFDEILEFLIDESGAISASQNYVVMQLIFLIARILVEVRSNVRGDNNRC